MTRQAQMNQLMLNHIQQMQQMNMNLMKQLQRSSQGSSRRGGVIELDDEEEDGKNPPPHWDSSHTAMNVRPCICSLEIWHHETALRVSRRGTRFHRSLPTGNFHCQNADLIPLEVYMSNEKYDKGVAAILETYGVYVQVEPEVKKYLCDTRYESWHIG